VPAAGHGEESRRDPNRQDDTMAESSLTQVDLERALAAVEEDLKMYGRQKKPGMTWMTADGRVFGAKADERGPIGGGKGYAKIVMDGDYRVSNLDELLEALKKVKTGQVVYVESDADIDCTTRVHIETLVLEIPSGVTLASNRGDRGSRGAVISSDTFATMPLLRAGGANVRITGLRIRGPDPKRRIYHHRRSFAEGRGHQYYYRFPKSEGIASDHPGLQVDNCELAGWSHAAVNLGRGRGHHIHHNYIHHNQYAGLGYGICLNESEALIEGNLFDYNRHSIAGTGRPGTSYEARHNVELGDSLSHCFDMHGGRDRKDGTQIAGTRIQIHHNTFRAQQTPVVIRGIPEKECRIFGNWFCRHEKMGEAASRPAVRCFEKTVVEGNKHGM